MLYSICGAFTGNRSLVFSVWTMGKDQDFLEAARNGNVVAVEKLLSSKAKRGGPLARFKYIDVIYQLCKASLGLIEVVHQVLQTILIPFPFSLV